MFTTLRFKQCTETMPRFPWAEILFCIVAIYSSAAAAESATKAPAGSRDNEIKLFSFCLGQASARVPRLTDAFNRAETGSAGYLALKSVSVLNHMKWMYKASVATINSVESPDSAMFANSKAMGEKKGVAMFEVEDKCLGTCAREAESNDLRSCVDNCTKQQAPELDAMIRLCETVQAKFQAAASGGANTNP